jgi:hypothetical protein
MGSVRKTIHMTVNGMRRWGTSPRHYVIAVLAALWVHHMVSPLLAFSRMVDVKITPWAFPFFAGSWNSALVILLGVVLLFCDAPFAHEGTPYECVRAGRRSWVCAQILYVLMASAAYVLLLVGVSVLCLVPNMDWANEWGRVYNTLAQTNAGWEYSAVAMSYKIILSYSPWAALLWTMLLLYLETVFVGLVMFAVNVVGKRVGSVVAGMVLAFLPAFASVVVVPWFYYLAPTAWANLDLLGTSSMSMYPSLRYALVALSAAIVGLVIVIVGLYRKREIVVLLPV